MTLRQKARAKGRVVLYLDIYKDGVRKYEFLNLYLVPETNEAAKVQNQNTMQAALAIRNQRELEVIKGKGGLDTPSKSKILLTDLFELYRKQKLSTGQSDARANTIKTTLRHLIAYKGDKITLGMVDEKFCRGFIDYLSKADNLRCKDAQEKSAKGKKAGKEVPKIAGSSASAYFLLFSCVLNEAVRKKLMPVNPIQYLNREDKKPIKAEKGTRTYLTIEEVQMLLATDYTGSDIKRAFLFSCFTGLRQSDVINLRWSNIIERDGEHYLTIVMKKTREPLVLKLNSIALKCLPEKRGEIVFDLPPCRSTINKTVREWAKEVGIKKHVWYHVSRHTFATLELTVGAELYTVSKLLGHTQIKTTEIYAKIIDKKKDEAVNRLSSLFE